MEIANIVRIIVMLFIILAGFAIQVFLKYKREGINGVKKYLKIILISFLCGFLIGFVYLLLPKYQTGIDVVIQIENTNAEIYINNDFYEVNESITVNDISKKWYGFIAIKTETHNKIVNYFNEKSIFKPNRKITLILKDGTIQIKTGFISIGKFIEDHQNYDPILDIFLKREKDDNK